MTTRLEVVWQLQNFRATASHLLQNIPNVIGPDEPLADVEDAERYLIRQLELQLNSIVLEGLPIYDCVALYRPRYWVYLTFTDAPQQRGASIVSTTDVGRLIVPGMLDDDSHGTISINISSEQTQLKLVRANFLVALP